MELFKTEIEIYGEDKKVYVSGENFNLNAKVQILEYKRSSCILNTSFPLSNKMKVEPIALPFWPMRIVL